MTVTELPAENTVPKGKYTFIGIDIDTTGRRILDEVKIIFRIFVHFFIRTQLTEAPTTVS